MNRENYELLQRIETLMQAERARLQASIHAIVRNAQENILSQLDDAIASTAAQVATLNTKVDAALAALAASVASQTPVTQAELDAIAAIGVAATSEGAKVDAALVPSEAPAVPVDDSAPTA